MSNAATTTLTLKNICKGFAGVQALHKVDFDLAAGEIHALLGENGAGKSTLIKVITGAYALDGGAMTLNGRPISPRSPAEAQALGISTVYQEVNLLPNLSVAHNLYLGREPRRFGCIDWTTINRDARLLLQRFRLEIDVTRSLSSCSIAVQQLIAIARGIDLSAKVLILDEPTASLDAGEVTLLFTILRELKAQGIGIIFITHFLDQVYAVSDRITVLRNGEHVATRHTAALERRELVALMLGRELDALEQQRPAPSHAPDTHPTLTVSRLRAENGIDNISFAIGKGEALGLAGLLGAGRTEVCEALFGLARTTGGEIDFDGRALAVRTPREAIRQALAMCPEDRKVAGIVGDLSIRENVILALQAKRGWRRPLSLQAQRQLADEAIRDLAIACPHGEKAAGELSGGNQQKVILARWLATRPALLILDEPTRGIDIGAHAEIIRLIRRLCAQGLTLVVASSELDELIAFSDKVVVLRDRTVAAQLTDSDISVQRIMAAIAQHG